MTKAKKNKNRSPRRKRMRRAARLQAAVKWRSEYRGKNLVLGYARWFGVDVVCAIVELRMLGVAIDAEREQRLRRSIADRAAMRARRRATKLAATTPGPELGWLDDPAHDELPYF